MLLSFFSLLLILKKNLKNVKRRQNRRDWKLQCFFAFYFTRPRVSVVYSLVANKSNHGFLFTIFSFFLWFYMRQFDYHIYRSTLMIYDVWVRILMKVLYYTFIHTVYWLLEYVCTDGIFLYEWRKCDHDCDIIRLEFKVNIVIITIY